MSAWTKYSPIFESDAYDPEILSQSAWRGHRKFAYDLVRNLQPQTIVELGTHYGASFFSMCQAVKDGKLDSKCYAVDTWTGDQHTGAYTNSAYKAVKKVTESAFPEAAVMLQMTFDQALNEFADESINLLHIDGFHTYEAVKHDYETWLPKLAPNGVVLFHDIEARYVGFGVYRYWDELIVQHPAVKFEHSHGLGILLPKGIDERLLSLLAGWNVNKISYFS
ncbi:class I SAM-dependent methyltransferase [Paenibacillus mesotrionivorans]|jgi:predicted O-methyltransferase YrrM|uniref:Class I SAM-dependent methyltransferase n=1 Tax=Paenibacillus mesotrionivorans TaxID=3160968 RepID=A0ACC7NZ52_9BACL